jgi:hypothetical protein
MDIDRLVAKSLNRSNGYPSISVTPPPITSNLGEKVEIITETAKA